MATDPVDSVTEEPVTREWLESLGAYELDPDGFYVGWEDDIGWRLSWGGGHYGGWSVYGNEVYPNEISRHRVLQLIEALNLRGE